MSRSRAAFAISLLCWLAAAAWAEAPAPAALPAEPEPAARALANSARQAVQSGAAEAAGLLGEAEAASGALDLDTGRAIETRLHVLRSRMLWLEAPAGAEAGALSSLLADLGQVERAAAKARSNSARSSAGAGTNVPSRSITRRRRAS